MSVPRRTRPSRLPRLVGSLVLALALAVPAASAGAADPRLDQAQARREAVQARLDDLLARIGGLEAQTSAVSERLDALNRDAGASARAARAADRLLVARMRESYKRGQTDPALALLGSATAEQATEQARLLAMMASTSRAEFETATAARSRTRATAAQVARAVEELKARQTELDSARAEVADLLAQAEREELEVRATLAAEQRARARAPHSGRPASARRSSPRRHARRPRGPRSRGPGGRGGGAGGACGVRGRRG